MESGGKLPQPQKFILRRFSDLIIYYEIMFSLFSLRSNILRKCLKLFLNVRKSDFFYTLLMANQHQFIQIQGSFFI